MLFDPAINHLLFGESEVGISNRHAVIPFIAGESKAFSGQRLARVGYKKTKDNPNPLPSVCASVPAIAPNDINEYLSELLPFIADFLEDTQDNIFRSLYESASGNLGEISDSDISVAQCISFLRAAKNGNRITLEVIREWFNSELESAVTELIAEKLGYGEARTKEQENTIAKHVNAYRELICGCTKKSAGYTEKQIRGIRTVIALASDSDKMAQHITNCLNEMEKRKSVDLIDIL